MGESEQKVSATLIQEQELLLKIEKQREKVFPGGSYPLEKAANTMLNLNKFVSSLLQNKKSLV